MCCLLVRPSIQSYVNGHVRQLGFTNVYEIVGACQKLGRPRVAVYLLVTQGESKLLRPNKG